MKKTWITKLAFIPLFLLASSFVFAQEEDEEEKIIYVTDSNGNNSVTTGITVVR